MSAMSLPQHPPRGRLRPAQRRARQLAALLAARLERPEGRDTCRTSSVETACSADVARSEVAMSSVSAEAAAAARTQLPGLAEA